MQAALATAALACAALAPGAAAAHGRQLHTLFGKKTGQLWGFPNFATPCGALDTRCCWPTRWNPNGCSDGLVCGDSKVCVQPQPHKHECGLEWQVCCSADNYGDGCKGSLVCDDGARHAAAIALRCARACSASRNARLRLAAAQPLN